MQLCLALDLAHQQENILLLKQLKTFDHLWIKVGLRSFIRDGHQFLKSIKMINNNFKIFLDLKLYDIPNTMADAAYECANLGVDMITIHASSGYPAMQTLMERLNSLSHRPLVLGVTALTSFDNSSFQKIYHQEIKTHAIELAKIAYSSHLDGVVCSVFESLAIKQNTHENFLTLTPGIRPFNEKKDDQQRVGTIKDALLQKSDFIVVGRPIYQSSHPLEITKAIYEEMKQ